MGTGQVEFGETLQVFLLDLPVSLQIDFSHRQQHFEFRIAVHCQAHEGVLGFVDQFTPLFVTFEAGRQLVDFHLAEDEYHSFIE